jgi:SPP1 gp7 family putative phage head morphogenesis protein
MAIELEPLAPLDALAALRARRGNLVPTDQWTELWQTEHARAGTVARSAGFDVLDDIFGALEDTLAEGKTFRDFAGELAPTLIAKGWWGKREDGVQLGSMRRLRTIFDANLRVSYAAGAWATFERNKATRPWLRYVAVLDGRARPAHAARHNLCLHVDDPYWDVWGPPCGWNCRCTLQSLSDRDVDRMRGQLKFTPPPDEGVRIYVRKATGAEIRVPLGIDPGWGHNPGKAGHRAVALADKLAGAPPELAAAAVARADWPARPLADEFEQWVDDAIAGKPTTPSTFTVGAIDPPTLAALKVRGVEPESAAIVAKSDLPGHVMRDFKLGLDLAPALALIRRLPETLASARAVLLELRTNALLYVFDQPDEARLGKIVVAVNYVEKISDPAGRRRMTVNSIRSARLVALSDLANEVEYVVVSGSLGG